MPAQHQCPLRRPRFPARIKGWVTVVSLGGRFQTTLPLPLPRQYDPRYTHWKVKE